MRKNDPSLPRDIDQAIATMAGQRALAETSIAAYVSAAGLAATVIYNLGRYLAGARNVRRALEDKRKDAEDTEREPTATTGTTEPEPASPLPSSVGFRRADATYASCEGPYAHGTKPIASTKC
jgi:hypothetical protein